jgi:hypothetical protein
MHDMPVAFTWLLILLTAPAGFLAMVVAKITVSEALGLAYHPFFSVLPLWVAAVFAGYFQWFVVVPWIARPLIRRIPHLTHHSEQLFVNHPRKAVVGLLVGHHCSYCLPISPSSAWAACS